MSTEAPSLRKICFQHLESLKSDLVELRMAVVSSADGFPIAVFDAEVSEGRKAAAMAAALDGLCKSMAKEFTLGTLAGISVECEYGLVLCRQIRGSNRNLVVLMVVGEDVSYGHALWLIKKIALQIEKSLQGFLEQETRSFIQVKD